MQALPQPRNSGPRNYCLTTAEILYFMPDHPSLLQSFVWQQFDLPPEFPALHHFLDFWRRELDGHLHRVRVAAGTPVTRVQWGPAPPVTAADRRRQRDRPISLH